MSEFINIASMKSFIKAILPIAAFAGFLILTSFYKQKVEKDAIVGTWLIESGEAKVSIYKNGEKYYGKIVWLKEPNDKNGNPKKDSRNQDEKLKDRTLDSIILIRDLIYNSETKVWHQGKIYKPGLGQEVDCIVTFVDNQTIKVKGMMGLLSETQVWKRVQ